MSQENVEIVREGLEQFRATGEFGEEAAAADFVWDMSNFLGWPEQQVYEGAEGARSFLTDWTSAWDEWELEIEALHDAGERVVAVMRQRGRSKATGMPVDMLFAQVWTLRGGEWMRMDMYSDPSEALKAVGLAE
jgi:ketosteroid isomerase-like protein